MADRSVDRAGTGRARPRSASGGPVVPIAARSRDTLAAALVAVSVAASLGACHRAAPPAAETVPGDGSVTVPEKSSLRERLRFEVVEVRNIKPRLLAPAAVEADPSRLARIVPPLTGQVRRLLVRQGEAVTKGQPLFVLDAPDLVAAEADYLRAKTVLVQSERALNRQKDLFGHSVAAQREVEEAQTAFEVAREDVRRAEMRLKLLGVDLADLEAPLTVRSPLAGQVLSVATAPGEFRNDPTSPLLTVADLSTVWVTANVPEKDVERVHVGEETSARVAAFPSQEFKGKVLFIDSLLDADTRSVKVRIQFENPATRLKPGMFATVSFFGAAAPTIVVPTGALLVSDTNYVWVEKVPWTFVRRPVVVVSQDRDTAVIGEGLKPGDKIVVHDGALLQ